MTYLDSIYRELKKKAIKSVLGDFYPSERSGYIGNIDFNYNGEMSIDSEVNCKKFTFKPEIDDIVTGYQIESEESSILKRPLVICAHQTTDDITVGKDEPAGLKGKPDLAYGYELAKQGFVAVCIDYIGFGGYEFPVYKRGYKSVTAKGLFNHIRLLDAFEMVESVDISTASVIGHSLGGTNALLLACFEPRIKAAVCSAAVTTFTQFAKQHGDLSRWSRKDKYMPLINSKYKDDPSLVPFDISDILACIAPKPLFINAPQKDEIFDFQGAQEAIQIARGAYQSCNSIQNLKFVYPNCTHNFPIDARQASYAFLKEAIAF